MAVEAPALTDQDIQQQVVNELKWDAEVEASEIGVAVKEGLVTLTGWVDRFGKKWAAERAVLRVRGVKAVANEIEVRLPAGDERTDLDIAAAAAHALAWNTQVPDDAVQVTVSNGWVTLRGEVDADFQRREAQRAVRNLFGVRGITNLITVRPHSTPMPDYLKDRIANALIRSALTDARRITVTAAGGRVILTGTVRSWAERQEAERVAWSARGVTEVGNRIKVRS